MSSPKPSIRPDASVLLRDFRHMLREEHYEKYISENKKAIPDLIDNAFAFMNCGSQGTLIEPTRHQHDTDKIFGHILVSLIESGNENRKVHLNRMIRASKCCAHTNYQFIRNFLRRNLAPMLKARKLDLASFPELFPENVREQLESDAWWKQLDDWVRRTDPKVKPYLTIFKFGAVGTALGGLLLAICKGEFTHAHEVMPVLVALSRESMQSRINIAVGSEKRRKTLATDYTADNIVFKARNSPLLRYYVLPREYVLMISGFPGEYAIYWGFTRKQDSGAADLVMEDWDLIEGDKVIAND